MVDTLDQAARSALMGRIRGKDTRPELIVRKLVYAAGYRYRLHVRKLPGSPDLLFAGRRKMIFVHGCFWHMHENCPGARMPKSRVQFWRDKLDGNKLRDARTVTALFGAGSDGLVVWECELRDFDVLGQSIRALLGPAALVEPSIPTPA